MQAWKRIAAVIAATVLAGCSETPGPLETVEPPVDATQIAHDNREILMAILEADGSDGDSWNRIIIEDAGRTERQATVSLSGTDGRSERYRMEKRSDAGWVVASREEMPAISYAASVSMSEPPVIAVIRNYGGFPAQVDIRFKEISGSVWEKPSDFAGNDADEAYWLLPDPASIVMDDVVWRADFREWFYCRRKPDQTFDCRSSYNPFTSISFGTEGGANVGAQRVWLNYDNSIERQATPVSVSIVSGPSSITSEGSHTWTASASGGWGTGTYSYQWQISTNGGSTWTSACSGTGNTCTRFIQGGAPSFLLRVNVTSTYAGQSPKTATSPTFPVTVDIPVNVYITGPSVINTKKVYSYTATVTGVSNPTYQWFERQCTRYNDESSCTAWIEWWNMGNVFTKTLAPDCSGTRENNVQIRARVVRPADGRIGEQTITTSLCLSPV